MQKDISKIAYNNILKTFLLLVFFLYFIYFFQWKPLMDTTVAEQIYTNHSINTTYYFTDIKRTHIITVSCISTSNKNIICVCWGGGRCVTTYVAQPA